MVISIVLKQVTIYGISILMTKSLILLKSKISIWKYTVPNLMKEISTMIMFTLFLKRSLPH
jgi:hypothetical protein